MRCLIVYASRYGQTERVARRIGDVMQSCGAEVHVYEVSAVRPDVAIASCDVVVLAGSVYFGKHAKKLVRFAAAQQTSLAKVKSVFVSVSGAARTAAGLQTAEESARAFLAKAGWTPTQVELVAGGEPYTKYGFLTRWFMVQHARRLGRTVDPRRDYDFTDWDSIDRLARSLAGVPQREIELALV
jgi:menaquinone-dependent protoporphyrinogen oxidase